MCGRDSLNGAQKCPLNLCCSYFGYCGTTPLHCSSQDAAGQVTPCQKDYGRCGVLYPPSCPQGTSTSKGRKVAYYQAAGVRYRKCNRITPSQINTEGLTHLNFAFAQLDPTTFAVVPADPLDLMLYRPFTALKSATLQTWIALGGFTFNDPGPTHTTFSDMVTSPANRAAFIKSIIEFMGKWGFQGADLDWEFPGQSDRGGRPSDAKNLVLLVKEMRAAFGRKYGLSTVLPPDFTYLSGNDPVGMSPYVDFFNYMTYDLHGPWEASYIGAKVRPQTSIIDVDSALVSLWFDGVPPSKVNLGIAYYGRGFTLTDKNCREIGCPYSGGSKSGPCTGSTGVLSLREIKQLVNDKVAIPKLLPDLMIKEISYDDQWIGYDDAETITLKEKWGDRHCLGGTAIWSIDFDSGAGSGDKPLVVSTKGSCANGQICLGSSFGDCCSSHNFCGSTSAYCSTSAGCQLEYGTCTMDTAAGVHISINGRCGNGFTCAGSAFGKCCSPAGYCGSSSLYCSPINGCQSSYGLCIEAEAVIVSKDGHCGDGITCQNSAYGNCCSQYGWCGTTAAHCAGDNGCQPQYGACSS
ncbi:bacteriodes thetaiotaomicron symbiotic chitinase [Calycina marina]|uniref:chitinase n=1 Tax=Calycina marina TaxID=1763456 RepID=A0A9P8CCB9_9HELO|nr:bacteriodes thetaiotaomicron symbiotic chitinase [Calycina marina]